MSRHSRVAFAVLAVALLLAASAIVVPALLRSGSRGPCAVPGTYGRECSRTGTYILNLNADQTFGFTRSRRLAQNSFEPVVSSACELTSWRSEGHWNREGDVRILLTHTRESDAWNQSVEGADLVQEIPVHALTPPLVTIAVMRDRSLDYYNSPRAEGYALVLTRR